MNLSWLYNVRDHCINGHTFETQSPFYDVFVNKEYICCIKQMIEIWHLLINSLFHVDEQNIFVIVVKKKQICGIMNWR